MGLAFKGADARWAYGGFMRFRERLANEIGICLELMEGFKKRIENWKSVYGEENFPSFLPTKPLKWDKVKDDIVPLLLHSDCDGKLSVEECKKVAPRLRELIKEWDDNDYDKQQAILLAEGMEDCIKKNKSLIFC